MRLITRSDFDGLACAVLLKEIGLIDEYLFVHPKDVQDGKVDVTENDVLTNVPYAPGCGLWFDHHSSEKERLKLHEDFKYEGMSKEAPSCARVIYDYYGGAEKFAKFDESGLMAAVDKSDSAQFTREEILNPEGWVMLSFIMDARTGLGRYKDYRISNYALMEDMIDYCLTKSVDEILEIEDVKERIDRYQLQEQSYREMIHANAKVHDNVLLIDLRSVEEVVSGNRFVEYAMYPNANVSMRIIWGLKKQNVVITCGYSIINKTCTADIGSLMLKHGGGGHKAVGTCQIPVEKSESAIHDILDHIREK